MILGTAGHIDHGKTTLVQALTGINTDRLKEEKARGITIELGFAHLDMDGRRVGVVDVPGHERFVRHMVAGAGGIDVVMMVVAADEGVMPQTREHLEICQLMGVEYGLTVLTKVDMVDEEWLALVEDDVKEAFAGSFLDGKPIVTFSAMREGAADAVRVAIAQQLVAAQARQTQRLQVPRLPVDRVFTVKGFGTVVTGTLLGGSFALGDEVELVPGKGLRSKIRKLQMHGEEVERVEPGSRTAINLAGLHRADVRRGQVVAPVQRLHETSCFDAQLDILGHIEGIGDRASVLVHTLTQQVVARVITLDAPFLAAGARGYVQLRTDEPVPVIAGDRFVLRGFEDVRNHGRTVAGGRVLDPLAPRFRQRHRAHHLARLEALASDDARRAVLWRAAEAKLDGVNLEEVPVSVPFASGDTAQAVRGLQSDGELVRWPQVGERWFARVAIAETKEQIIDTLRVFHKANKDAPGIAKEQLRRQLGGEPSVRVIDALLDELVQSNAIAKDGEFVRLASFAPPRDDVLDAAVERAYLDAGLAGFAVEKLEETLQRPVTSLRAAARRLFSARRLVRVKPDFLVATDALDELRRKLDGHFGANESLSLGELRDLTGLSRKHMIPLVEYIDRQTWTRRDGDVRRRGPAL